MTVEQAHAFFTAVPAVASASSHTLLEVGLGYITLGQSRDHALRRRSTAGEARRWNCPSATRAARSTSSTSRPRACTSTTSICCSSVLHRLRDHGNTVVVIEHNLDVIKTADWVIDLGPEGGDGGGRIIAEGTPEEIARNEASFTGAYLRQVLALPAEPRKARQG